MELNNMKPVWKLTITVAAVVIIILLILLQTGVFSGKSIAPGNTPVPERKPQGKVVKLTATEIPAYYRTVGTVRSRDEIELSPRLTARIQEVTRRSGDSIKQGELLIKLDSADLQAARNRAADNLTAMQATLERVQKNYLRQKQLFEKKAIADKTFETAEEELKSARAAVAASRQNLNEVEANLSYSRIESPMNAIVAERYVDPGDMASPGNVMLKIFDPTRLMLYVPLREGLVGKVKVGDKIDFKVGALNQNFTGEVREIIPSVDSGSRTFMIKMCILGNTQKLMPGMFGTVKIKLGNEKAYIVPEKAIIRIGQLEYLTIVNADGNTSRVLVRTIHGTQKGTLSIVSGIEGSPEIVVP